MATASRLLRRSFTKSSERYRDNVVLDPFGGTGTVAVVAKKTGRHFIHVDVSNKYCQIAAKRLQQMDA
jgi:DNA modification methylase